MKFLFDLFPVILFFAVFKFANLHYAGAGLPAAQVGVLATQMATLATIAATVAQVAWSWWRHRRVDAMLWVSLVLVCALGGATVLLHDQRYIQMKPTALYWLFAAALLISRYAFGRNLIQAMMQAQLTLPEPVWHRLNLSWACFFAVLGAVNLYVAHHYSLNAWVNFKLFGTLGLMVVFILLQGVQLAKYLNDDKEK